MAKKDAQPKPAPQGKAAAAGKEDASKDTGLHISMRALLSIIAGLLVAEAVKACVVSITGGAASEPATWINTSVALAGTLFVTRVVTDNLLYYTEPDIRTDPDNDRYRVRVLLIALDLLSYGACYAIVLRLTLPANGAPLTTGAVRWSVIYATLVEFSHAVWCFIARRCLPNADATDRQTRDEWLNDWFRISGISFVTGLVLSVASWRAFHPGFEPVPGWLAFASLSISGMSTIAYLIAMRKHYARLRSV